MNITWYGTAALVVCEKDTVIAFDPFSGIPLNEEHPESAPVKDAEAFRKASSVFVTHGHFDHIFHIPSLYGQTDTVIYTTKTPEESLVSLGLDCKKIKEISPHTEMDAGDISVRIFHGRHCRFDAKTVIRTLFSAGVLKNFAHARRLLAWKNGYPENDEILFYELAASGKRLQIMGSMGLDPDEEYPTGADALILPFQGRSDLDKYGEELVKRLGPKSVLLDHYDDSFPPMSSEIATSGFEKLMNEKHGIPCRAMKYKETIGI